MVNQITTYQTFNEGFILYILKFTIKSKNKAQCLQDAKLMK